MSAATGAVLHPRLAPRRGGARSPWWGKAWQVAVEESTFSTTDAKVGGKLARSGAVGRIAVDHGSFVAGVKVGDDVYTVDGTVEQFDDDTRAGLVEIVAAGAGRIGALLAGDLPKDLVADGEEVGVELLPYSGDLGFRCSCEPWADPCPHAVAVATQVGWLLDADPFVLLALRGCDREWLLGALNDRLTGSGGSGGAAEDPEEPDGEAGAWAEDLTVAEEAALRADRLVRETAEIPPEPR